MREILFRGKRKDNGEWVEGYYDCLMASFEPRNVHNIQCFKQLENGQIIWTGYYEVIPETVGEFTDRVAEEEKKIFEGDKCILTTFDHNGHDYQHEVVIEYLGGAFYFVNDEKEFYMCVADVEDTESDVEVIGNIHDTDLLKGEDAK